MAPQLFHLEGPSLEELKARAAALYGPRALIVSAELVTVGGIRGVLSRKHYEIVVEVPEPDGDGVPHGAAGVRGGGRSRDGAPGASRDGSDAPGGVRPRGRRSAAVGASGLDALLQQAELDEVRIAEGTGADRGGTSEPRSTPSAAVSTDSGLFAALMDELTFATDPAAVPAPPPTPSPVARGPEVAGAGTVWTRRSVAVNRDAVAEVPDRAISDPTEVGPRSRSGREPEPATGPDAASDAAFLHEGAGDPTDLPDVRGQVLRATLAASEAPSVLRAPGDLVVVIGAPAVGWAVASSMSTVLGRGAPASVAVAGPKNWASSEARSIDDRLAANAARAAGVDGGHAVFVALSSEDPLADGRALLALRPDQAWLAVDAGRKEADTAAWVGALCRSMERAGLAPAGIAVVGSASTATPETVQALGLPIGWLEGRPAGKAGPSSSPAAVLAGPRRRGGGRRRAEPAGIE